MRLTVTTSKEELSLRKSNVLGVEFVAEPFESLIASVLDHIAEGDRDAAYLCPTGVHGVIEAQSDPSFRRILNAATFNVADGMPIVFASRLLGQRQSERAFGPDVMWRILSGASDGSVLHYFYGGNPGVADRLADTVCSHFPRLGVAGTYCPPFRPLTEDEKSDVVGRINASRADVVWVGLSTPKQERWVAEMRRQLNVRLICTVGAAFDYHTGSIKPAPQWMKRSALEWMFRLGQEPRRLWRRYLRIVPTFLVLITLQLSGIRTFSADR